MRFYANLRLFIHATINGVNSYKLLADLEEGLARRGIHLFHINQVPSSILNSIDFYRANSEIQSKFGAQAWEQVTHYNKALSDIVRQAAAVKTPNGTTKKLQRIAEEALVNLPAPTA